MIHFIWIIPAIMVVIIIASSGWRPDIKFNWRWVWIVGAIAILLVLILGIKSCSDKKEAEKVAAEKYAVAHPPAPAAPLAEGTTPCTLYVGWGTIMKTGARPVFIKYHGKTERIRLSGRENDKITLDQFSPGDAEFTSTDGIPVHVQIFPPAR